MLSIAARRTTLALHEFEGRITPAMIDSFVTISSSVFPSAPGQAVTLTASATYDSGASTRYPASGGDITLYDDSNGGAVLGKQSLSLFKSSVSVTTTTLTPGEHKLRAYFTGYTAPGSGSPEWNTATPASATFTQTVLPAGPALTLTPATLPNGVAETAYSTQLTAFGRPGPYTYAVVEPAYGVNVSPDGLVTYAAPQTTEFQVLVTEGSGLTTTFARRLFVPPTPTRS